MFSRRHRTNSHYIFLPKNSKNNQIALISQKSLSDEEPNGIEFFSVGEEAGLPKLHKVVTVMSVSFGIYIS